MFQNFHGKKKPRGQGIVRVSDLFKKYTQVLKAPQGVVVTAFIEVVKDLLETTLTPDQCTYSVATKTLVVRASGMLKTEIILQKKNIIDHLKGRLGEKSAPQEIL